MVEDGETNGGGGIALDNNNSGDGGGGSGGNINNKADESGGGGGGVATLGPAVDAWHVMFCGDGKRMMNDSDDTPYLSYTYDTYVDNEINNVLHSSLNSLTLIHVSHPY